MKTIYAVLLVTLALTICSMPTIAQTFDLQFVTVLNNGVNYDVKVQIKSNSSTFGMGSGNLVFVFTGAISSPTLLTAHNFTGGSYDALTVTSPAADRVSINIGYNGGTVDEGQAFVY